MVEFIGHKENDKSAILISDVTLPQDKIDVIKEKLLEHEYVKKVEIQRNNREIELTLTRTIEECPDCPRILKEHYNSVVNGIK
jgi:hypothetical protein